LPGPREKPRRLSNRQEIRAFVGNILLVKKGGVVWR